MIDSINSTASASPVDTANVLLGGVQNKPVRGNEEVNEPKGVPDIDDTVQISKAAQKASDAR